MTKSAALRPVLTEVEKVAPTTVPVLISGETGTGKDLLARHLHRLSKRASGPFVRVDCAILVAGLLEAELFGHVRGAFTGASEPRAGRAKLADGGTLFLDEIGELPCDQQCKLLRLIQEKEFEPVGSSRTVRVDVRIIAATNRDLEKEVAAGRFRADLFYRLEGYPLSLPPLRDRIEDLPSLIDHLLRRQGEQLGRIFAHPPPNIIRLLQEHSWPGNIRELKAVIERACIRAGSRSWLPEDFATKPCKLSHAPPANAATAAQLPRRWRDVEREHLQAMLELADGVIEGRQGAASILGISPSTLRHRLRRLGLSPSTFRRK